MAKVSVLATGCSKCGYLLKNAQAAADERGAGDTVEKVDRLKPTRNRSRIVAGVVRVRKFYQQIKPKSHDFD